MKYPNYCIVEVYEPNKAPWKRERIRKKCYTASGKCKIYYNEDLKKYYLFENFKGRKDQEKCYEIIKFCGKVLL